MMAIRMSGLRHWRVSAVDGEVGTVEDVLFDDRGWVPRYLVVETGSWLQSRAVLLSPASLRREHGDIGMLRIDATREQVRQAPDIDTEMPVSRHEELAHAAHYGYPPDWFGPMMWGAGAFPGVGPLPKMGAGEDATESEQREAEAAANEAAARQTHLGSGREVLGYRVEATDGDGGDLDDIEFDVDSWQIRALVIDTHRWWPGGQVRVEPSMVTEIRWAEQVVRVNATREALKHAPRSE
ncbi:MAG TPA: PRC-barrel domain-containing protein [Burkholderiaceae bacterium]|nr:PRC-barrel domain-containing protein [Burkholderiaceae bacterium]